MKKLMAIFAHPDDEGAISGTLAHYAQNDTEVTLICATKGEVGGISDPALATPETLGEVRTAELEAACKVIGIDQLQFLGYRDSGMVNTPPNEDPRALVQVDPEEAIGRIVTLIRQQKPDVVITFEPYGWYGHPDHRAVYRLATAAYERAGDPAAYPSAGAPWQPQRLFYAVLPISKFQIMVDYALEHGLMERNPFEEVAMQKEAEAQVTHILDTQSYLEIKQRAMQAHKTQFGEDHWFRQIPPEVAAQVWGEEHFILVTSSPAGKQSPRQVTDLFSE